MDPGPRMGVTPAKQTPFSPLPCSPGLPPDLSLSLSLSLVAPSVTSARA